MKALLIIDMQKVSFTPKTPRFDADGVIERINMLSEKFRENSDWVIFIQHDGTKEGFCLPQTEEWEILSSLKIRSGDKFISKMANDAFYNNSLKDDLLKSGIREIVITGCATDFCVDSTVKSALNKDFHITVISDGHTTTDRGELTSKQVIDYYNWIWSELTPTNGKIQVMDFEKYYNSILPRQ